MYELARGLQSRGALHHLYTGLPNRAVTEVPSKFISSRVRWTLPRRIVGRVLPRLDYPLTKRAIDDFDSWVSRRLVGSTVVTALSAHASRSLAHAKTQGSKVVCDRGSWHILEAERVLMDEARRWGLGHIPFDQWGVERELSDYHNAHLIIVPSRMAAESFARQGVLSSQVAVVPFGVDLCQYFLPSPSERDQCRIISVGNIGLRKGQLSLLTAYANVRSSKTSLQLLGHVEPQVARLLTGFLAPDIEVGRVPRDQVASSLRKAGIFVLASVEEGLPLSLLQAMATGMPVIATEATGASDVITHGVDGIIVPPSDPDALTEALTDVLSQPELARSLGTNARRRAELLRGWNDYAERVLDEYGQVTS